VEPPVVECIVGAFREMPRSEFEEVWFGGSSQPEIEIIERCQQQG
jgi:hypothetical protein